MFKNSILKASIVLALDAATTGAVHLVSDDIRNHSTVDAGKNITVTITRAGTFTDPRYGEFTLSTEMFDRMIKNFDDNVFGQKIALDVAHDPNNGAAGYFTRLFRDGLKLRGEVELTSYGVDAIKNKGHIYLSAEIHPEFIDNETQQKHGTVLLGAGLVVRPCIKRLDPIELSDGAQVEKILLSEKLRSRLEQEDKIMWKKLIKALKEKLIALKLDDGVIAKLILAAEENLKAVTDEKVAQQVISLLEQTAENCVGQAGVGDINLSLNSAGMSEEQVLALFAKHQKDAADAAQASKQKVDDNVKLFNDAIDAAKGINDEIKLQLKENAKDFINGEIGKDAINQFALNQIALGNQLQIAANMRQVGFQNNPTGSMAFGNDPDADSIKLENKIHGSLKLTSAFQTGQLRLTESDKLNPFVKSVLKLFDQRHASAISKSVLALTGETSIADTDLPVAFQREVIREALSDLNILSLVQSYTDGTATATTQIPFEERDTSNVTNDGIVFERQGIPKAKVRQKMDLGYLQAMKIAIDVSNEVMHLTQASQVNWDAWGRNVASAARLMRELVSRRIANEMQRVSDSYGAVEVTDESIASQLDGSNNFIRTAAYPIVRPFQQFDMAGNTIGNAEHAITVDFDGTPIAPFDGSGTQDPGTYYVVQNYNLGYVAFVDEAGDAVTPNEATATISYSNATNVVKVDADLPANTSKEVHLNKLLQAIGGRKAYMSSAHFINPDFLLMSPTLNDECTNAEQFAAERKRDGTNTNSMGDLETVKGISAFGTNAPGIDLGDERIIMGQKNVMSYVIAKPWTMSEMIEGRDESGALNGTKEAYGEEYNCIKAPKPLHNRFTSVLYYSFTNR